MRDRSRDLCHLLEVQIADTAVELENLPDTLLGEKERRASEVLVRGLNHTQRPRNRLARQSSSMRSSETPVLKATRSRLRRLGGRREAPRGQRCVVFGEDA